MSIRTRLLFLVLAVWLPAAIGFGLIARSTYVREDAAARGSIETVSRSLSDAVQSELDKRAAMARALAASQSLEKGDLAAFLRESRAAALDTDSWVVLTDPHQQLGNTLLDALKTIPRAPNATFTTDKVAVSLTARGPVLGKPVIGVFAPEAHVQPPRYNVVVSFGQPAMQRLLADTRLPDGAIVTIVDQKQFVVARSVDSEKWFGVQGTGETRRRLAAGESGFASSVTLDGVESVTYITPPNRYGWAVVVARPRASLAAAARRATAQVLLASGVLLVIGLALASYASRQISGPMLDLRGAASELGRDRVPARLVTGLSEADEVGGALHEAGLRAVETNQALERKVREAVLQAERSQAQLLDEEKHAAVGRLAGGIAHDFNNLLQTIGVGLHVLERADIAAGPHRRALDGAMRATARAADLVRQMLAFGRPVPLRPQPIDLADFFLKTRELTAKAVGERIELRIALAPNLPAVYADASQFELALLNVILNARDAMPDGGLIAIEAALHEGDGPPAAPAGTTFIRLQVRDNGQGMDEATRSRAFEPYFTTKPVGHGSGIGLSQVRAFARRSGGDARIESTRNGGTAVILLLPVTSLPQESAPVSDTPVHGAGRPLRILMVEDDPLVCSVVPAALEADGHVVRLFATADAACAHLEQEPAADYDVLFTDLVMPGHMTGSDLVEWCKRSRPELAVVVASGYSTQRPDASVAFLSKPYDMRKLADALQRAAGAKQATS